MSYGRGRNRLISEEKMEIMYRELSRGLPVRYAVMIAGIGESTHHHWMMKGKKLPEDDESIFRRYYDRLSEAKALAVASRVEKIRIDPSWQAQAWWLERAAHEDFGRKQTIDANVNANVKSEDISKLFDNEKVSKILEEEKD